MWSFKVHCHSCNAHIPTKIILNGVISPHIRRDANAKQLVVCCPECGATKRCQLVTLKASCWRSTAKWWNPLSWGKGYWEIR